MAKHERADIIRGMARLEGQLRGIHKMLEEDRDCPEVLTQLAAARAALDRIARLVFEDHLDHCLVDAVQNNDAEAKIAEIKAAFARYFLP